MLHLGVITLLPGMFDCLNYGVIGRAVKAGIVQVDYWNPRDWALNANRQVDDRPYGGGPGMVVMYEPLHKAIEHAKSALPKNCRTVFLSPQGRTIRQPELNHLAREQQSLLFIAGRYEGVDERIFASHIDEEWSLGDFVLSGGELAAMVFIDAMVRLLPGALGHVSSASQDSFMAGILDYPHYTRPADINGNKVPLVLLNGNHNDIERWRRKQALGKTWIKRPDLLQEAQLSTSDIELLDEFKYEYSGVTDD